MLRNNETVETKLQRIAAKASRDPKCRFTSLFHLVNVELLRSCFLKLRKDAAAGIDQVTKTEYGTNLEENLTELVGRLHRMAYIPQPVRRVFIPKPGSKKQRPLGIPALEDKLVQAGLTRILTAIYESDFIDDAYGFRPNRGCHDALRALRLTVENGPVNHIVDADIKGFFDNVDHEWMKRTTSRKKLSAAIRKFKDWLKENRTLPTPDLMAKVSVRLQGHYAYYGVTDNSSGITRYAYEARNLLFKWLNRRGNRGRMNWEKFNRLLERFPLPKPQIRVSMWRQRVKPEPYKQRYLFA